MDRRALLSSLSILVGLIVYTGLIGYLHYRPVSGDVLSIDQAMLLDAGLRHELRLPHDWARENHGGTLAQYLIRFDIA